MIWPPSTEATVLVSAKILPPPTGISDVGVPPAAAELAPEDGAAAALLDDESAGAVGTGGLLQAASAPAPTTTPATRRTPRRSVSTEMRSPRLGSAVPLDGRVGG